MTIDSSVAETIVVSESEAEEEEEVVHQAAPSALARASSSCAGIRISRSNPLLNQRIRVPEYVATRVLRVQGIDCAPDFLR